MTSSTYFVRFPDAGVPELVEGANRAEGSEGWAGASEDLEWQAEQAELLELAAAADAEAISLDE